MSTDARAQNKTRSLAVSAPLRAARSALLELGRRAELRAQWNSPYAAGVVKNADQRGSQGMGQRGDKKDDRRKEDTGARNGGESKTDLSARGPNEPRSGD